MIFRQSNRVTAVFQHLNKTGKQAYKVGNKQVSQVGDTNNKQKKAYQKLLYEPQKAPIKIQDQQQPVIVRPRLVLDTIKSQFNEVNILQKVFLTGFVDEYPPIYEAICISITQNMVQNIKNDRVLTFQLKQVSPSQLNKMIKVFYFIQTYFKQKVTQFLNLQLILLADNWFKEQRKLKADNKTWQDSEIKLKYEDIETVLEFIITRGFVPKQMMQRYIQQLKNIPQISKSDSPNRKLIIFKQIKNRIKTMYIMQEKYFKSKSQLKDNEVSNQHQDNNQTKKNNTPIKNCSQEFQKQIGKHLYQQYCEFYLQIMLNYEQIIYLVNIKDDLDFFRTFLTRFLFKQQIYPKVKQAYSKIFLKLLDFQNGSPLLFTNKKICVQIFQTINDMFSPINPADKKLVHHLLRQCQRLSIIDYQQTRSYDNIYFYLSRAYFYQSQFLYAKMGNIVKQEGLQLMNQISYNNEKKLMFAISMIKFAGFYLHHSQLLNKKLQEANKQKSEISQPAIQNRKILQIYNSNIKSIMEYLSTQKGQQIFTNSSLTQRHGSDGLNRKMDAFQKGQFSDNNLAKKKIRPFLQQNRKIVTKKLSQLDATKFGVQYNKNLLEPWHFNINNFLFFNNEMSLIKLFNLIEFLTTHLHLSKNDYLKVSSFRFMISNNQQIVRLLKQYICFPYLLRSLVELFSTTESEQKSVKTSQFAQKQMDLFRFIDKARDSFSSQFKKLCKQDPTSLDKFNQYPNIFSNITQFKSLDYTLEDIGKDAYQLKTDNINANLINDIYGQLLVRQSQLKIQVQKQLQNLRQKSTQRFIVQKNYIQYPYITDFFVKKGSKLFAVMLAQRQQRSIYEEYLYQISIKYFENQKFKVVLIKNVQELANSLEN